MFKESKAPTLSSKRASPSPSEGGDVFPPNASFYLKEPLFHVKRAFLRYEEGLPKPLRRRGCIPPKRFFLSKRASLSCEKGVSLPRREPFFTPTKRLLYFQLTVFTPLSIRRGVGGEAFLYLQIIVFTPLSIRRGGGGEASFFLSMSHIKGCA